MSYSIVGSHWSFGVRSDPRVRSVKYRASRCSWIHDSRDIAVAYASGRELGYRHCLLAGVGYSLQEEV